jgi:hypothetical protein
MAYNCKDFQQQYYSKDELGHRTIEYFQSKFECRIEDSREYNQYVRQVPYHRDFYDTASYKIETQVVPMKAIHLTSDSLNKLVAEQEHMYNLKKDAEEGKRLWIRDCEDRRVRNENPAVEKAYRNYQMLLELCRK